MTQRFDFLSPVAFGSLLGLAFGLTALGIFGLIAAIFGGIFVLGFASYQMGILKNIELPANPDKLYFANTLQFFLKPQAELRQEAMEPEPVRLRHPESSFDPDKLNIIRTSLQYPALRVGKKDFSPPNVIAKQAMLELIESEAFLTLDPNIGHVFVRLNNEKSARVTTFWSHKKSGLRFFSQGTIFEVAETSGFSDKFGGKKSRIKEGLDDNGG